MDEKVIMTDATVSATKQTLIEMAERAWLDLYGRGHNQLGFVESLNRFASLVRRDERNSWPKRTWVGLTVRESEIYARPWNIEECKAYAVQLRDKNRANTAEHAAEAIEYLLSALKAYKENT